MIVKVQTSLVSSDGVPRVLIYDRSRSFTYEGGINADVVAAMAGRKKAFFVAALTDDGLSIGTEVSDPGW